MNRLEGVVIEVNYLGGVTTYKIKLDTGAVVARVDGQHRAARHERLQREPARDRVVYARRLRGAGAMR